MRIWDIDPGYLNRQSLLGEHRELHGLVAILTNNKKGYSSHPETLRWKNYGWALKKRHQLLAAEMTLRGYHDRSPVALQTNPGQWPGDFIDEPANQFLILKEKYKDKDQGRIPLPENAQQLWRQHKYSVLARDVERYRQIGKAVAAMGPQDDFAALAMELTKLLRTAPTEGGIRNALQHMWGYVSKLEAAPGVESWPLERLLRETQRRALAYGVRYLVESTGLGELGGWLE